MYEDEHEQKDPTRVENSEHEAWQPLVGFCRA